MAVWNFLIIWNRKREEKRWFHQFHLEIRQDYAIGRIISLSDTHLSEEQPLSLISLQILSKIENSKMMWLKNSVHSICLQIIVDSISMIMSHDT